MPEIEVNIFNQTLKLSYQENEKQRLINAVETLNQNWSKFSDLHGKVSDLKIITLISLELQDTLESMKSLKDIEVQSANKEQLLKKEISIKSDELEKSLKQIKKYEIQLKENNKDFSKIEILLDEINTEVTNIKNNLLQRQDA